MDPEWQRVYTMKNHMNLWIPVTTFAYYSPWFFLHNWNKNEIDYVQAFPQAAAERYIYLKVPAGFEVEGGNKGDCALKLNKNVYEQKQAGRVWYKYLPKNLTEELVFERSQVYSCDFYRGKTIYVIYTYDSILAGTNHEEIE